MRAFASLAAALLVNGAAAGLLSKRQAIINEALEGASQAASQPTTTVAAVAVAATTAAAAAAAATTTAAAAAAAAAAAPVNAGSKVSTSNAFNPANVASQLMSIGFKAQGQNSNSNNGQCWLGSDGPNTNLVKNGASESIIVVVWGAQGSWMTNAGTPPLITVGLSPGQSTTISCGNISGGMAAVYGNTKISQYGQIDQTWVEFTYGQWGTVDVSREVNMSGNPVSVVGSKCTTDMNTCVFTCKSGNTCMAAGTYQLNNCSGPGGQTDAAGQNGGCFMGPNAQLTTTFS